MRLHPADAILYLTMRILKFFDMRQTDIEYFDSKKVKNILIVSSTAIGDTLLSTPAIRAVRKRYPKAKILSNQAYRIVIKGNNSALFKKRYVNKEK